MAERRSSVDKKNKSRKWGEDLRGVSSIQKRSPKGTMKKVQVTCIKCRWTKLMTQTGWNVHQWKVHGIRNEVHIGAEPLKLL